MLEFGELEYRLSGYRMTLRGIAEAPWAGFGYGSFEDAFKLSREPPLDVYFDHAHNDYLESALELGVPMAICLVAVPLLLTWRCALAIRGRHESRVLAWAAACASLLVGLHALADFSLQIPAVGMLYAALLGCGCAQSWGPEVDTSDNP
jgi:O-antigen ligase